MHIAALSKKTALVVDDTPGACDIAAKGLELVGFTVHKAENGRKAYDHFLRNGSDLVVTDYQMPLMDGVTLIRKIKTDSPDTPVILVSGLLEKDLLNRLEGCNVWTILQKPYSIQALQRAALSAVESGRTRPFPARLQPVIRV